jgi:hypothetical protein
MRNRRPVVMNKKLTPEEMLECITGVVSGSAISIPKNWIYQVMQQYAAQEVSEKDAEIAKLEMIIQNKLPTEGDGNMLHASDAYHAIVDMIGCPAVERVEIMMKQIEKKDALLKEAIEKGESLYNALMSIHMQFGDEKHAFKMSNELYNWCEFMHSKGFKTIGKEDETK